MATQPAFTPGPWAIDAWSGDEAFVTATHPVTGKKMHVTMTAMRDDATLIAAAPDLVEVLETIPVDAEFANADLFRAAINAWWDGEVSPVLAKARGQ